MIRRSLLAFFFVEMFASAGAQSTRADQLGGARAASGRSGGAVTPARHSLRQGGLRWDQPSCRLVQSAGRRRRQRPRQQHLRGARHDRRNVGRSDRPDHQRRLGQFPGPDRSRERAPGHRVRRHQLPRRLDGCAYARRAGLRRARNPGGPGARPGRVPGLDESDRSHRAPARAGARTRIPPWRSTARASWWPGATRAGR